MTTNETVLQQLVEFSRRLGDPVNDYAILGEGNSSASVDRESFYVKASGATLCGIGPEGFGTLNELRAQSGKPAGSLEELFLALT